MGILQDIRGRAKKYQKTICLPESLDDRTLQAAATCRREGFGPIVLVGDTAKIKARAGEIGVDLGDTLVRDPAQDPEFEKLVATLVELRQAKGMTPDKARQALQDGIMYAAMLVKLGKVDGYVSGAVHSTADTLRPALQVIKAAKGVKTVSAFFMMVLPESSPYYSRQPVLFFGDSGLVQNPSPAELADIAIGTARSWTALVGSKPVVAMLSHSTKGSAKHADVDKVTAALELVRQTDPGLEIDGELQADAALIPAIGEKKAPGSRVAGQANVLIFPDLDAGNIAYKLVERLAGATAIGPLISGLAKPVNDLSRGCKAEDIVDAVAVTACQAAANTL
ncbi:MAG: phosphate acetyltransferase [Planctomycetota bacterium]|jgi:phosphate acetyltransferase|nr:phosphate acetyltransferase [Planctomycetota bacterium]